MRPYRFLNEGRTSGSIIYADDARGMSNPAKAYKQDAGC